MKKLFSVFLCLAVWLSASAYDFEVGGIYYNIIGNGQVEVTCYRYGFYSGDVTIPSSVTYNNVTYSVTSIDQYAFYNCSSLTSVTIPNSVTSIDQYAFYNCSSLTSVTIPNSVTSIGSDAFSGCSGLTSVTIPNSVTSIGDWAFSGCSGLTSITIPNSVTSIRDNAFRGCSSLTSMTIPNSVTSIGDFVFYYCSSLTSVTIPNSVTSIGNHAFYYCRGLTSVTIPNSVTSIGGHAFSNCSGLTSVTIPNSVTYIGDHAFSGCSSLTSVSINGEDIGDFAFSGCSRLTSVTISSSVTSIGSCVFNSCDSLTSISVDAGNTHYDSRNNCNAIIETSTNELIAGCMNTVIPNSVTSIGGYAFAYCSGLTSVDIPNSVTSIGNYAFAYCSGLTSVDIPNSVISIGGYAFYYCSNITDITCLATTPPTIRSNTFTNYDATLYVPSGSISLYSAESYWMNFNIQPIPDISNTITVNSNDEQMGTTLGSGTYEENTTAQLVAVTQAGYSFQQWSDGNTDNPRNVVVTSDSTFTAEFAVASGMNDTIYLEYDGKDAMQYPLEEHGVYYFGGKVYNSQNLYIKLYYSDGKLLSSGTNDIDMSSCPNGIYIVTDGKGGFLKINHYR